VFLVELYGFEEVLVGHGAQRVRSTHARPCQIRGALQLGLPATSEEITKLVIPLSRNFDQNTVKHLLSAEMLTREGIAPPLPGDLARAGSGLSGPGREHRPKTTIYAGSSSIGKMSVAEFLSHGRPDTV